MKTESFKPKGITRSAGELPMIDNRGWTKYAKEQAARLALKGGNVSVWKRNKLPKE